MRASFRKRSTRHMHQATEVYVANQSTSIARSSLSSAEPTLKGSRPHLGTLLLGYYDDHGKLIYADRVGTGMPAKVLADCGDASNPLARSNSPLGTPPPRETRFGSPLVLSRVHWVKPQLVAEITYLTWTEDGLLRHVVMWGSGSTSQPLPLA